MEKVKKIVVPVDYLENTDKLLEYGLYMGSTLGADVEILHVVGVYQDDAMFGVPVFSQEYKDAYMEKAQERMKEILEEVKDKAPNVTGHVIVGDPMTEIVAYADKENADLIVISTHGAQGIEKILLGSVAQRVVKLAHCPVLVMNPFKK